LRVKGLRGTLGHKMEDGENYKIRSFMIRKGKGKVIPLQARCGPEGG